MNRQLVLLTVITLIFITLAARPIWQPVVTGFLTPTPNLSSIPPQDVNQFTLESSNSTASLTKENGQWRVSDFPADATMVARFLDEVSAVKLESVDIVSTNPDNFSNYTLGQDEGVRVTLNSGSDSGQFFIGRSGSSTDTFYLKPADQPTVYLIAGQLDQLAVTTPRLWRDKTIVSLSKEEISKLEFTRDNFVLTISRDETSAWQAASGPNQTPLDANLVNPILESLSPLIATDILPEEDTQTFDLNTDHRLKVWDSQDNLLFELSLEEKEDGWWVANPHADPLVLYFLPFSQYNNLFPDPQSIFTVSN